LNISVIYFILAFSTSFVFSEALADNYTPDTDNHKTFECKCVIDSTGCQSKFITELSKNSIHTWYQSGYFKKGETTNLNELCYRNRDVFGGGLCCTNDKEYNSITELFNGSIDIARDNKPTVVVKVEDASYRIPALAMQMKLTITNNGKNPVRLDEFNAASVRFLGSSVFKDTTDYPVDLLAEDGLTVSDNSPLPPGETRTVEVTASDAAWEVYRMSDIIYEPDSSKIPGQLSFVDSSGNRQSVLVDVPLGSHIYPVWYGTNRVPVNRQDEKKGYTSNPEPDSLTHYGKCLVVIPKSHTYGSVGSPWYRRWIKGSDDRLSVKEFIPLTEDNFIKDVSATLSNEALYDRSILVYIHGFNVSFEEAAIRAAQIGFDLKVPGITSFYSWPSQGKWTLNDYMADADNIKISEESLANFLVKMANDSKANRVHIIAHSMGNQGLLNAMNGAIAKAAVSGIKFGQIFLAAPDVDVVLFKKLASIYPRMSERTTLYVSAKDKVVEASSWLRNDQPRVGYTPPITIVDGIDTIEATKIDIGVLGHSYFSEAAGILHDMHDLLLHNDPPKRRTQLIRHTTAAGEPYWEVQ